MNVDLEKYLNDEMGGPDRLRFEQQMRDDPALRSEVEEERAFLERLKTQMLRERIAAVLSDGGGEDPPEKTTGIRWVWLLGLLLLASVAAFCFLGRDGKKTTDPPPVEIPQLIENNKM